MLDRIRKKSKQGKKEKAPDYEKLGRLLYAVGQSGCADTKKLYRIAFFKGVWSGLGSVIGATIFVAALLWLFTILGNVPLVGPFIQVIRDTISEPINK